MGTKLEQLYLDILDYCSLKVDDKERIVDTLNNDDPITIDAKTLIFPSQAGLKQFHPDKTLIFHPLSEYINRGESEVVRKLRYRLNITLNFAIIGVGTSLLKLIGSTALHKRLTPQQRELLLVIHNNDVELAAKFSVWAGKVFGEYLTSTFVNLYLKKAGTFKGQTHARVGIVSFDYATRIEESKLKPDEKEAFLALFRFMFPGSDQPETYNDFSDSRDAPWLECLLKTSYTVASRLNELIELYSDFIDQDEVKLFNTDWLDGLDHLEAYQDDIRRIPSQRGNEGTVEKEVVKTSPVAQRVTPAAPAAQQSMEAQVVQPFVQHPPGHMPAAIGYPPGPVGYPAGYPAGYPQQAPVGYPQHQLPVQQPPQPQQVPRLQRTSNGKLSFSSIEATNPAVAMAGMVQTGVTDWMMRQQQQQMAPVYHDPRLAPSPNALPPVPPGYQLIPSNFPPGYQIVPIQQAAYQQPVGYPGATYGVQLAPHPPGIRPI